MRKKPCCHMLTNFVNLSTKFVVTDPFTNGIRVQGLPCVAIGEEGFKVFRLALTASLRLDIQLVEPMS